MCVGRRGTRLGTGLLLWAVSMCSLYYYLLLPYSNVKQNPRMSIIQWAAVKVLAS